MFYTYILHSKTQNKFYIGHTADLELRLKKHKGFTGTASDWKIVFSEAFHTKEEAYARERQSKAWKSKAKVLELINGD